MSGFWKFTNSYASRVSKILEKDDFTLEELLDERETVPELLGSNTKLVEYLRQPDVLEELVDYVVEDDTYQNEELREREERDEAAAERLSHVPAAEKEQEAAAIQEALAEEEEDALAMDGANDDGELEDIGDGASAKETSSSQAEETDAHKEPDDSDDSSSSSSDDEFADSQGYKDEEDGEEEESVSERHTRRAQVAAEILSVDVWSLTDAFMENTDLIQKLWSILDKPAPLPIFSATYFMKINEHLLDMKTPEMIQFILMQDCIVDRFMRHIDTPPLMDFLLKVISTDKPDASTGIIELLKEQELIPSLISYLASDVDPSIQSSASDFLKAFITISANNAESTTVGPNELTRQLVSEQITRMLVNMMLEGGTGLSSGVGIVIEVIRKNNSDYDPVPVVYVTLESHPPTPRDPIYLGTLVRVFAEEMPKFTAMLEKPVEEKLQTPFGEIEPLGFERFKICELVAELIHCSNMALLNDERGEEIVKERDQIREKLIERHRELVQQADADSTISWDESDISREIQNLKLDDKDSTIDTVLESAGAASVATTNGIVEEEDNEEEEEPHTPEPETRQPTAEKTVVDEVLDEEVDEEEREREAAAAAAAGASTGEIDDSSADLTTGPLDNETMDRMLRKKPVVGDLLKIALFDNRVVVTILQMFFKFPWNNFLHNVVFDIVQQILNASVEIGYNRFLAIDLFDRARITELIVDGYNRCVEYEAEHGIRLGYMGHLTLIAEEVVKFVSLNLDSTIKSKPIEEAVSDPDWDYFVSDILVDTRNKYNAVLGNDGVINSAGEDDDDDDDDDEDDQERDIAGPAETEDDEALGAAFGPEDIEDEDDDEDDDDEDEDEEYQEGEEDNRNGYFDYEDNDISGDIDERDDLKEEDRFSRYMSQEMTNNLHDRFGSSDEESEEEEKDESGAGSEEADGEAGGSAVDSQIGSKPYHAMEFGDQDEEEEEEEEDDDDEDEKKKKDPAKINDDLSEEEYEDPNDDGQSYAKASHPLYQADGTLNYPIPRTLGI